MTDFIEIPAGKLSLIKRKPICGVGINDATYQVRCTIDGKTVYCPYYTKWKSMIDRCYSKRYHKYRPTYNDCSVCDDWKVFSVFRKWMESMEWQGMSLDKDIIKPYNRVYCPEFCCFVPLGLNNLLLYNESRKTTNKTGAEPIGKSGGYFARCRSMAKGIYLGAYNTQQEAFLAYKKYKLNLIKEYSFAQKDERVKSGLMLHYDILLNIE